MSDTFSAVKVSENVYWVGAIDWNIRDFHGYQTNRGTTYNAYLILADKITLIDTVKKPFVEEMFERIKSVVDPSEIKYIISNHAEMDHSGGLPWIIDKVKPEKIFASEMGAKALADHFHMNREIIPVKDSEKLSLGNRDLIFIETKMLHWPDSMFTYFADDEVLFSQDAFGMHLATSERFADEIDGNIMEWEGAKYFANILLPFSPLVMKLLERAKTLPVKIGIIAPDHGPIWRKNIDKIINFYAGWAGQKPVKKAVIAYDSMWGSTDLMARVISEGMISSGICVKLMSLHSAHRSDIVTELLDAGAFIVGSPTINNNIFPSVADLLYYVKGLKPKCTIGGVFGSYGWSGEAASQIKDILKGMNIEVIGEGLRIRYVPDREALEKCRSFGIEIGNKIGEVCK